MDARSLSRAGRLRVGVPKQLLHLDPRTGHGRVWSRVLARLGARAKLRALDPARRRPRPLRRGPEVVLADGHSDLPAALAPLVVELHEAANHPLLADVLGRDFHDFLATRTERAVRAAARVITLSESSRRDIVDGYGLPSDKVHAVPLGVEPPFGPEANGGRSLIAAQRGGVDAPYVLFAAALHPRKNLPALREAMATLIDEGLPHVLAIAGGPPVDRADATGLEQAAVAPIGGTIDRVVRFAGLSDQQLAGLMAEADAFCLPSLYEGFGLTVLEAMACGTPVVVSDRGALPEVVGGAGVVTAPTPEGIADGLRRVLADPAEADRLGAEAAERARGFTWQRTAEGWLEVLQRAAEDGRR